MKREPTVQGEVEQLPLHEVVAELLEELFMDLGVKLENHIDVRLW
jgi:hypothetical protein